MLRSVYTLVMTKKRFREVVYFSVSGLALVVFTYGTLQESKKDTIDKNLEWYTQLMPQVGVSKLLTLLACYLLIALWVLALVIWLVRVFLLTEKHDDSIF
jgi:hypothetical protein